MKILDNLKISRRLLLGFGCVTLMMFLAIGGGIWGLNTINTTITDIRFQVTQTSHSQAISENLQGVYQHLAIMILETDPEKQAAALADLENHRSAYLESIDWFQKNSDSEEEIAILKNLSGILDSNHQINNRVLDLLDAGRIEEARQLYLTDSLDGIPPMEKALADLDKSVDDEMVALQKQAEDLKTMMNIILIAFAVIASIAAVFMVVSITASVNGPIQESLTYLTKMSKGDFSISLSSAFTGRKDEMGDMGRAIALLLESMRTSVSQVRDGVETIASASTELSAISTQMNSSSSDASTRSNGVATAAEQMSANTFSVAAGIEQAVTNLRSVATATEEMTATIGEIAGNSEKARRITGDAVSQADIISAAVRSLGQSAQDIGKVTETITSISNQTNLLALNATIEAARAPLARTAPACRATANRRSR